MRLLRVAVIGTVCMGGVLGAQTTAPANGAPQQEVRRVARVSSGVMQGQRLTNVAPIYPANAKKDGVHGTVVMHAVIGKDGRIDQLEVISGPEELEDAALDAVRQWTYKPYLLNGEPTEVDTTIIVNFNLSPRSEAGQISGERGNPPPLPDSQTRPVGAVRISSGVMAGLVKTKVNPVYPADAHVAGVVVLHVIVGKDGHVDSAQVVSGPAMLQGSALDAVRHWVYKPYLLNGEPTEVDTTVIMNFNMNGNN